MHNIFFSFFKSKKYTPRRLMPHQVRARYGIPETIPLTVELQKDGWMVVTSPALPGLVTQARNPRELLEMVNDAVLTYYDVPTEECDYVIGDIAGMGEGALTIKSSLQAQAV